MSRNLYIVPFDFSEVSQKALDYALFLGEKVHTDIKILHLCPDKAKGQVALQKITELIEKTKTPEGVSLSPLVRVGSIFEDLGKVAKENHAQLIIMGTHGISGLQRFFGSYAMKVITSCEIPFLIVQKKTEIKPVNDIVVPIDLTKESLQIVKLAGDMAHIVDAKVHILGEKQTDELLTQQMKNRITIVKNQYEDNNVDCTVEFLKARGSYYRKIEKYCAANSADMIALAYHSESLFPQFDTFAQRLITNKNGLPCMIINSKLASALYF